jgi:tRNA nucleotidyltransferase (CCA-adding enzyme)
MLERQSEYLDLDFVLLDAVKTARAIARSYQAGFVLLDQQRQIARVVFPHATVDFAQQEGSLETDLNRRDFTINAIAYNPHNGEIIDPLQGCADLKQGLLRMVKAANLQDDPLKAITSIPPSCTVEFCDRTETQATIRQLAPELSKVASERVRVELNYLLVVLKEIPGSAQLGKMDYWRFGLIMSSILLHLNSQQLTQQLSHYHKIFRF